MLPDPKWLDVLKLPLRATTSVALAAGFFLVADLLGWFDLGPLGPITRPIIVLVLVGAAALSSVTTIYYLLAPIRERQKLEQLSARRAIRRGEQEEEKAAFRAKVLAWLNSLSRQELRQIAKCLRDGSPSFYTYVHSPAVSNLQAKGLVWTPGGPHHQDHYPFTIRDFVWEALQDRKDEFLERDNEANRLEQEEERRSGRRRRY